jgi:hypothetical protein
MFCLWFFFSGEGHHIWDECLMVLSDTCFCSSMVWRANFPLFSYFDFSPLPNRWWRF